MLTNIGYLYTGESGKTIVPIDYEKAFKLFEFTCKNSIGASNYYKGLGCYNLGVSYDRGWK